MALKWKQPSLQKKPDRSYPRTHITWSSPTCAGKSGQTGRNQGVSRGAIETHALFRKVILQQKAHVSPPRRAANTQAEAAVACFCCWKHSRQNTGRPCVGRKGTVVSRPHCEQT